MKKLLAELLGSFMIVSGVCGTGASVPAGSAPWVIALGSGLALIAAMAAFEPVSGAHFNPAITVGLAAAGRHPVADVPGYLFAQIVGAALAGFVWFVIASARNADGAADLGTFLANGYAAASPGHFAFGAVALAEILATALLVIVFAATTANRASAGLAPVAVGSAFTGLMLLMLPIDGGGLNPARSTASALLGGNLAIAQLWVFWSAPLAGAVLGGWLSRLVTPAA